MSRHRRSKRPSAGQRDGLKACTPLRKLISMVASRIPEPHHSGAAYYREWIGAMPTWPDVGDGPDDELAVTWCDGELCACLPELIRYLKSQQRKAGGKGATECYRELLKALVALEGLGSELYPKPSFEPVDRSTTFHGE